MSSPGIRQRPRGELVDTMGWLWDMCGKPTVAGISVGNLRDSPVRPRVLWMLGGVLGRLPLHACGNYSENAAGQWKYQGGMADSVVSCYISTLKSFSFARRQAAKLRGEAAAGKALVVGATLAGMEGEAREVGMLLGDSDTSQVLLNPSFADMMAALPVSSISQFVCHGISDAKTPIRSFLKLPDYKTNPLNVGALMALKMSCGLAYLSACETAASKRGELVDESLHLLSGFLLAGCPRVVGTLWGIPDGQAVRVATSFYRRLPWKEGRRWLRGCSWVLCTRRSVRCEAH